MGPGLRPASATLAGAPAKAAHPHASCHAAIASLGARAIALGQFNPDPKPTEAPLPCDAALRRWHSTYAPTLKATTEASTNGLIKHHLAPFFGSTDLCELTEEDLLRFASAKLEAGLAPKTIENALAILRRVLNLSMREGLVTRNPASRIGGIMRLPSYTVGTGKRAITVSSTNHLVRSGEIDVRGGKTGFISRSGYCLATLLRLPQSNHQVAVVVLGAGSNNGRFWETRHLFNWLTDKASDVFAKNQESQ